MEQQYDFDIRYHYIEFVKNLGALIRHLYWDKEKYGKDVTLDTVYTMPEVGYGFAQQISWLHGEVFLERIQFPNTVKETVYAEDMIGQKGIYFEAFVDARKEFYEKLFLTTPEKLVLLTSEPDLVCRSCQINGNGNPGNHCTEVIPERKSIDYYFEEALVERYNTHSSTLDILPHYRGSRAFLITLGTLRDRRFLSQTTTLAYKILEEENKKTPFNFGLIKRFLKG